jgi:NAD(P)H-flavin reductase
LNNPYLPIKAQIMEVVQETTSDLDIKTFKLKLPEDSDLKFMPGQFLEVSIPGVGEAPFGFASSPLEKGCIELCIKKIGALTQAVHELMPGDSVYLRGPFGNTFPVEEMEGSDLIYITGGLGLAPLRPLIDYVFDSRNRGKYGDIRMLFAARSSADFIFRYDYEKWERAMGRSIVLTIDRAEENWKGRVGFPHTMTCEMGIACRNTYALLCGPPMMIKAVSASLVELGLPKTRIITTLENRMTCGIGKCGKCNVGHQYVCVDGPVFRMSQLSEMPDEY